MSQQLTDWFPADVKPVHIGVYEVDDMDGFSCKWYAYWNGRKFGWRSLSIKRAFLDKDKKTSLGEMIKWRGLAVNP